ncbi:MAG: hypothetical protein RI973_882 [Bacteroidota bacterium]|jgi:hypothetical protein
MTRKIFLLIALLASTLSGSLQAQYTVTGCERVTGLQSVWDTLLKVSAGGSFVNTGTVKYSLVASLVNNGGFSDQSAGSCTADYTDPCGSFNKVTGTPPAGGLNVFGNSVDSTRISGSQPLRMHDVQLSRNILLDNEWQLTGILTWNSGLITTSRGDLSHFLHFMNGSSVTGDSITRHVDGYAAWSGAGNFTLPIGDGVKLGRLGLSGSCGSTFKAAYFSGDPGSAALPAGAPFSTSELGNGLCAVSDVEYWDVDGAASTSITLHFAAASGLANIAADTAELVVAGWDGMKWVNLGSATVSGTLAGGGSVTSDPAVPDQYTAFTFGVYDKTAPSPACQDVTLYLDATGTDTLIAAAVDNGSTDNCAIDTLTLDIIAFNCSHVGSGMEKGSTPSTGNTVTLTVTDDNGNTATCTASVTVLDTIKPSATCQNVTVYLDATGNGSTTATAVDNGSADVCGIAGLVLSDSTFNCNDLSAAGIAGNTVTLTVTDDSGNSRTCTASVTVQDTIKPSATCQNVTVYLDATGNGSTTATAVDNGSADACGIASLVLSDSTFNCSDIGTPTPLAGNTVTLTVTDDNGNSSTCTAPVSVQDTIKPSATCQNVTVYLDATGNGSTTATAVDNGSTDACGIASLVLSDSTFNCNDVGGENIAGNTVTLTVTDDNSNTATCTSSLTVLDTIKPVASCQDVTVSLDVSGNATITALAVDNNSSDNCSIANRNLSQTSFNSSDVGANTVTLTVSDPSGNTSTCTATVTVEDDSPPDAKCQNLTRILNTVGTRIVAAAEVNNNSTDASGIASIVLSQTSFNCSHLGPNLVTLTVTDVNGNSSTCSATITIVDNTPPQAFCQNTAVVLNASGLASLTAETINNGSTDACGISSLSLSQASFTCNHVGTNTVTLTVTDLGGNTNTCSATVTVADNTPPIALCQPATLQLGADGTATMTASAVNNNSTDACGIGSLSLSQAVFSCVHLGVNPVTLTVADANGNTGSCSSTITVVDQLLPKAQCKNATAYLGANGQVMISPSLVNNSSIDNCGIAGLSLSNNSFDCSDLGPNTVTLTVTDASGNSKSCNATVTVADNLVSTLVCKDITLPVTGGTTIQPAQVFDAAASGDNCGTLTPLSVIPNLFNCINSGPNLVTLTASDSYGNTATCQATVTVQGPIITAVPTPEDCNQLNGTMVVTAQNFVGQPGYSIDNGANYQLINIFDFLEAGIYPVVVTFFGADNCTTPPIYVEVSENKLTNTWTGAGDGISWTHPLNWSLALVPVDCHQVVIPPGHTVLLKQAEVGYGHTLDVQAGSVLTTAEGSTLNVRIN